MSVVAFKTCPACRKKLKAGAAFCKSCGFRLEPIPAERHRKLSEAIEPLRADGPPPAVEPAPAPSASRRCQRVPLSVEVSYTSEHNFYTGFMENLGSGGLFVATHTPSSIGDELEVSFTVPGLERLCTAVCQVRWIRESNPHSPETVPGMGLQFARIEADARAAIELFIQHREPIFFEDE